MWLVKIIINPDYELLAIYRLRTPRGIMTSFQKPPTLTVRMYRFVTDAVHTLELRHLRESIKYTGSPGS